MKKTMQDLADELNLSRTTISLVLKGKGDHYRICQKTQEKILKKVEEEQFKPNFFAQNLNSSQSMTIGILFPDLFEDYMGKTLRGIGEVLDPLGYTLILMTSNFSLEREKRNIRELLRRGCEGMIMMPVRPFKEVTEGAEQGKSVHLEELHEKGFPLILLDRYPCNWRGISVTQDDRRGGSLAGEYLVSRGCQRFYLISLNLDISSLDMRIEGFTERVGKMKRILLSSQDRERENLEEDMQELIREILTFPGRTGIFVTTAGLALWVNSILEENKLKGGKDFYLIRFGSNPEGYSSTMAGIKQPHYEMGRRGAELLIDQLNNKETLVSSVLNIELDSRDC